MTIKSSGGCYLVVTLTQQDYIWEIKEWPLSSGGCYSEVAVNTSLTVQSNLCTSATNRTKICVHYSEVIYAVNVVLGDQQVVVIDRLSVIRRWPLTQV